MRKLELPPRLAYELEKAAGQAGAPPEALSVVLLKLAAVLSGTAEESPFAEEVRTFLRERGADAQQVGSVLSELVGRCLHPEAGGGELAGWRETHSSVSYELPTGMGVGMVREPMYAYGAPSPAPLARPSAMGRYGHLRSGSEEFARAKAAEIAREDRVRR